jgi:tRNA(fMet)-specific endonuclease VapC
LDTLVLLDTNTCLDFLLARSDRVRDAFRANSARLSVSAITVAQLRVGSRNSDSPFEDDRLLDLFLTTVASEPFDDLAARAYGEIARKTGVTRASFDLLIAAHAIALGRPLITNNERDFRKVIGLQMENWTV